MHPFVSPAAHPLLQTITLPLRQGPDTYELAKRWLADGELPPPDMLRTEDFLAVLDYEFPRPTSAPLGLSVAGGPSPFGASGMKLLHIGVQAASEPKIARPPTRLVVALDASGSMRWGGRFDSARKALAKLAGRFDPGDRFALVVFHEDAEVVLDESGTEAAARLPSAVQALSAGGATNLGAALCLAYSVAEQMADQDAPGDSPVSNDPAAKLGTAHVSNGRDGRRLAPTVRVVLLTDGLAELDQPTADRIQRHLAESANRGIRLDIVDIGQEKGPDPQLADFARAGGGEILRAAGAEPIRWALSASLAGRPQTAAAEVALKVSFNPKTVAAYRLFGHEAKAVAGILPDSSTTDFHFDESATALFEVQLRPEGGPTVATAELSWQPADGGTRQSISRTIQRNEFAGEIGAAPLALQEAAIAAAVAELLRKSPFAALPYAEVSWSRVRETAAGLDSRLRQRPTYLDFLTTVEKASAAASRRGGGARYHP